MTNPYTQPAETCPSPRCRPHLDLVATCSPGRRAELREIEIESTWRGLPEQRIGRARDGINLLCDIMGHGTDDLVDRSLNLFGEPPFRIALHHVNPGSLSPRLWKYWHLRLHGVAPKRPPPTMLTLRIASGLLPPDTPDLGPLPWPPS